MNLIDFYSHNIYGNEDIRIGSEISVSILKSIRTSEEKERSIYLKYKHIIYSTYIRFVHMNSAHTIKSG